MDKNPFTIDEQYIVDLIVKAHNAFIKLDVTHLSEKKDWCDAVHRLQDLLGSRVLRRDYPRYFYSIQTENEVNK